MANFCGNCGAELAQDSQICAACNAPAGVAAAGTPESGGYYQAAAAKVAAEASWSVPPFIWAGALQVYWLIHGLGGMLSGTFLLGAFGMLGYAGACGPGSSVEATLSVWWRYSSWVSWRARSTFVFRSRWYMAY